MARSEDIIQGALAGGIPIGFGIGLAVVSLRTQWSAGWWLMFVLIVFGISFLAILVLLSKREGTKPSPTHPAVPLLRQSGPAPATPPTAVQTTVSPTHAAAPVEGKKQCWNCKMWIPEIVPFCTSCGKPQRVAKQVVMVTCQFCHDLMPETSVFCPNCGTKPTSRKRGVVIE